MDSVSHEHDYIGQDTHLKKNEGKTLFVVILTGAMMVVEVIAGYLTGSMALLADGWHMASHAAAMGISFATYRLAKSHRFQDQFSFGTGKFIPLGGYTSAIVLGLIGVLIIYESALRLAAPVAIRFDEAIVVAVLGLVVNIVCAFVLHSGGFRLFFQHKAHRHTHDHNLRAAYFHVLADAFTSLLAIFALLMGRLFQAVWVDSLMGMIGSVVILKWAVGLCQETGWELLDGHAKIIDRRAVHNLIENDQTRVLDLHIWRIAPKAHACEMVVESSQKRGSGFYRDLLVSKFDFQHTIVEEVSVKAHDGSATDYCFKWN